jgi:DNA-binding MarR family transcriptional regulator
VVNTEKNTYAIFTAQHLLKKRLIKNFIDQGIKITPSHSTILLQLEKNGPQTMTELSKILYVDNSTVTGLVDRLEKMKFVCRSDHPDDRRKWSISISGEGRRENERARAVISSINKEIESGFSENDMKVIHKVLSSFESKFQ